MKTYIKDCKVIDNFNNNYAVICLSNEETKWFHGANCNATIKKLMRKLLKDKANKVAKRYKKPVEVYDADGRIVKTYKKKGD